MPCRAYVAPCRRPCRATAEKTTTMHGSYNKVQDTRPGSKPTTLNSKLRLQHSHTSVPHNIDRTKYIPTYIYIHIIYTHVHMHTFIYEYMMDLVAPLVAPALSQKPAFVTYFVARGAPRPCYIPEGFDSLPHGVQPGRFPAHQCEAL